MNLRLAAIAPWGREIVLPASILALLAAFGFAGGGNIGVAPAVSRIVPSLAADAKFADRPQQISADRPIAILDTDFAKTANALAAKAIADTTPVTPEPRPVVATASTTASDVSPPKPLMQLASADPGAPMMEATPTPASQKPQPIVTAALTDSSEVLPPEPDAKAVSPAAADAKPALDTTAVLDECFAVDPCVDRYLWALYQRTPKEDTVKETERREVTVKRKGKTVTVTRTVTRVVDEDFGWKDPKAADHVGMSMTDYVLGGMDRDFKLRLFRLLLAAEQAGLSPGITSAFRDDYRQSIASGLKAANDRSFHGGSFRGGYGHGLAADIVSVNGATRAVRQASSETLWNWVDKHGKDYGVGRPYHDHDPPHVGPIDGSEYVSRHAGRGNRHAAARSRNTAAARADQSAAQKRMRTANASAR